MADSFGSPNAWTERGLLIPDWRWLCRLSLVEPVVAVGWHLALLRSLSLPVAFDRTLLLFTSLWLVYMADRLLDMRRIPGSRRPRTERHGFVFDHPRLVAGAWCTTFALAVTFAFAKLSVDEWLGGGAICIATSLYLLLVHRAPSSRLRLRQRGLKELAVAVLFTTGSTLFVWSSESFRGTLGSWLTLGLTLLPFSALVLQNLMHLARHERHIDAHHNSPSIAWSGDSCAHVERALMVATSLAAVANLSLIGLGVPLPGVPLARLLPINLGVALGSVLLLLENRLLPGLNQDAKHLVADIAVLLAAVPPLVFPAPFG